jgi:hypothetical protein
MESIQRPSVSEEVENGNQDVKSILEMDREAQQLFNDSEDIE